MKSCTKATINTPVMMIAETFSGKKTQPKGLNDGVSIALFLVPLR
jgi:hypothetical protein